MQKEYAILLRMPPSEDRAPPPFAAIGKRLVQLRRAFGLNQTEFAARLGLRQHTLSAWEIGERRPGIDSALLIRAEYGATLDWLYAGDHSGLGLKLADAIRHNKRLD